MYLKGERTDSEIYDLIIEHNPLDRNIPVRVFNPLISTIKLYLRDNDLDQKDLLEIIKFQITFPLGSFDFNQIQRKITSKTIKTLFE